jgi:E3 ubiquitin-protein ligase TRIP12
MSSPDQQHLLTSADSGPSSTPHSSRRKKKSQNQTDEDVTMRDDTDGEGHDDAKVLADRTKQDTSDDSHSEEPSRQYDDQDDDDEEDDVFGGGFLGGRGHAGLSNTLRALSGMVSGISSRLRNILENLKQKDDPSVQLIALQELSELLLISTEESLAGHFSPDLYVKELVSLMQPDEFEEDRSEIMLLACRCLANLMEALPAATANVVYSGAVPVLCQKLLEISYIDLAEQALSVRIVTDWIRSRIANR